MARQQETMARRGPYTESICARLDTTSCASTAASRTACSGRVESAITQIPTAPGAARHFVRASEEAIVRRVNIHTVEFEQSQAQPGHSWRAAVLGPAIGSAAMGATLYQLPPGRASFPYHYEYG